MIIRRYGTRFHSVELDFDPAAMTEVGFRRDGQHDWDAAEFEDEHERVRGEEIIAEATDPVQEKAERTMLEALEAKFRAIEDTLEEGQYLCIESQSGKDYPRTRYDRATMGEKEFTYTLDQPLKLGIWRKKTG
jgi:hypothetical protein